MIKLLSYILSGIFGIILILILLFYHPLQWITLRISYKAHKLVADALNWTVIQSLLLIGTRVVFKKETNLPKNTTLIFAANHQSMFDIPPIIWFLRKHHPKFVAKIELGKGIPSVSINLRGSGAALIDRKDSNQAIKELEEFSKRIQKNNWSAAIFPEGTRSRDGKPKRFFTNGLKTIIKYNPDSYIVPISINNSWKIYRYGKFPLGLFSTIYVTAHEPIPLQNQDVDMALQKLESTIKEHVIV